MIIHLSELQDGENEFRFEEDPEDLHIHTSDLCFKSPIRTQLTVYKLGESCSVSGNTEFHLQLTCARCLEPFDLRLATPLSFVLQKGRPDSIEGDEDETLIWVDEESEKLDLGKEIKDYILLEIPMNPVCAETCAGLCPQCGENRNLKPCDCRSETVDPRWEALRALKEQ